MIEFRINQRTTHLPLKLISGSPEVRIQKAKKLTNECFNSLMKNASVKGISLDTFRNTLRKVSGGKMRIDVMDNMGQLLAQTGPTVNDDAVIIGHSMLLPVNSKDRLSLFDIEVFMHEAFHFFDSITNPKYMKRICTLLSKYEGLGQPSNIQKFYKDEIYNEGLLKRPDLRWFLKGMQNQKKIDILQYYRYQIIREINAYKAGSEYGRKAHRFMSKINGFDSGPSKVLYEGYQFKQKLALIEDELFRILQEERNRQA